MFKILSLLVLVAFAAVVFAEDDMEVQDMEAAEAFFLRYGYYPSWYYNLRSVYSPLTYSVGGVRLLSVRNVGLPLIYSGLPTVYGGLGLPIVSIKDDDVKILKEEKKEDDKAEEKVEVESA